MNKELTKQNVTVGELFDECGYTLFNNTTLHYMNDGAMCSFGQMGDGFFLLFSEEWGWGDQHNIPDSIVEAIRGQLQSSLTMFVFRTEIDIRELEAFDNLHILTDSLKAAYDALPEGNE